MVAEMTAVNCHHCHRHVKNWLEGKLHAEMKIISDLFCISIVLHYLCKLKQKTAS